MAVRQQYLNFASRRVLFLACHAFACIELHNSSITGDIALQKKETTVCVVFFMNFCLKEGSVVLSSRF